jgi:hypothetical protein
MLLGACGVGFAGYYAYLKFTAYQRHQAELAFCSQVALDEWIEKTKPGLEQFDRASRAASVAPRITLAPLILKLSEARAEFKKLPAPPPCAAEVFKLFQRSMELREQALLSFASRDSESTVASELYQAQKASQDAFTMLAEARAKAVK